MGKNLIGDTPIVKIRAMFKGEIKNIYAKLEYYNLTGSIKDRIAEVIINNAYKTGELKKGMPIIEATSGNTGISFSAMGARYGHSVHIFMPEWASVERIKLMQMFGATVHLISKEDGGFQGAIKSADNLAKKINGFRPQQFSNVDNINAHYYGTAVEIINKVENIDAFVCGFGTGGTLMGIAKKLRETMPQAKVIALEPKQMSLLSENITIGNHRIEGIGDDFVPDIIDKTLIDKVVTVDDAEAINMSQILSKKLGLGVGISSGANFFASVIWGDDNTITIFADDNKKYLSTDLFKTESHANLLSNEIEILDMDVL